MDEKTEATAACEEEEEEEPVEDILDAMDFEEISDGELEAEESRGGKVKLLNTNDILRNSISSFLLAHVTDCSLQSLANCIVGFFAGVDALTVDWAALLSQTRSREGEETREARTHRWQSSQLLGRLGVSMALCGTELANKLGIKVNGINGMCRFTLLFASSNILSAGTTEEDDAAEPRIELLDPVAGIHVALRARKQQRESIFQLRDRRGLSAADDLAFR